MNQSPSSFFLHPSSFLFFSSALHRYPAQLIIREEPVYLVSAASLRPVERTKPHVARALAGGRPCSARLCGRGVARPDLHQPVRLLGGLCLRERGPFPLSPAPPA